MNDSRFEDILKNKAQGYKPPVSPDVLTQVKAASGIQQTLGAKAIILKIISAATTKLIVAVVSLSVATYFTTESLNSKHITTSKVQHQAPTTHSEIILPFHTPQSNHNTPKTNPSTHAQNSVESSLKSTLQTQNSPLNTLSSSPKSESIPATSNQPNTSITTESNHIVTQPPTPPTAVSSARHSNNGTIPPTQWSILPSQPDSSAYSENSANNSNTQNTITTNLFNSKRNQHAYPMENNAAENKSYALSRQMGNPQVDTTHNYPVIDSLRLTQVKPKSTNRISIHPFLGLQQAIAIQNKTNPNDLPEKNAGKQHIGGIGCYYRLYPRLQIGAKIAYEHATIETKYLAVNGNTDGTLNKKLQFLSLKAGGQYTVLTWQRWSGKMAGHAGLNYQLKHRNTLSGKFFDREYTTNIKAKSPFGFSADFSFLCNYSISKQFAIEGGITSEYNTQSTTNPLITVGGKIGFVYKL